MEIFREVLEASGLLNLSAGQLLMVVIGLVLIWLAIAKRFEPLLLLPIGFGGILANVPLAGIGDPGGFLGMIYEVGVSTGVFPLLIFIGVGALTDFGPLLANPKTAFLGAAAQVGIFATLLGGLAVTELVGTVEYSLQEAAAIAIIGGADGPTAIFVSAELAPELLGAITVAAYSYMALVPILQPPIMRLLTTREERAVEMEELRPVSNRERVLFPLTLVLLTLLLLPRAAPLVGALMFGNLLREAGVVDRLNRSAQNELINLVTILLGLAVGSKLEASVFLTLETVGIFVLGAVAFSLGTGAGVIFAKLMNRFTREPINPLIGAAGVSAVPMSARVVNQVAMEANPQSALLMHAMGPNVAGVIGSAAAAGVFLTLVG